MICEFNGCGCSGAVVEFVPHNSHELARGVCAPEEKRACILVPPLRSRDGVAKGSKRQATRLIDNSRRSDIQRKIKVRLGDGFVYNSESGVTRRMSVADPDASVADPAGTIYYPPAQQDTRQCSVRGCSNPVPTTSTNKMCEVCRGRHRIYATTKRARRKLEKAVVSGGQGVNMAGLDGMLGSGPWMPSQSEVSPNPASQTNSPTPCALYSIIRLLDALYLELDVCIRPADILFLSKLNRYHQISYRVVPRPMGALNNNSW